MEIGELRLILKDTLFWSIKNQTMISTNEDEIVELKHTCYGSDYIFVKPKQLIFQCPGSIPGVIGRGSDEWGIDYSKTLPYKIPEPQFIDYKYQS